MTVPLDSEGFVGGSEDLFRGFAKIRRPVAEFCAV
jgi:hypothetical protein